jgi:hypothetical protein
MTVSYLYTRHFTSNNRISSEFTDMGKLNEKKTRNSRPETVEVTVG